MWNLSSIYIENICSFEKANYVFNQNKATLLFGNNLDNECQNSNGSGKSAFIESLAIAITGEPLRKVNMDEIINDHHDSANVSVELVNRELRQQMTIQRTLSRKLPQSIKVFVTDCDTNVRTEAVQATVADYNKYILDRIGLTKEDVFRSFILTARKYQSFLACSDKDKKDIINCFSNGILIDDVIENIDKDILDLRGKIDEISKLLIKKEAALSVINQEIEHAKQSTHERAVKKTELIASLNSKIIQKRELIRSNSKSLESHEYQLERAQQLQKSIERMEDGGDHIFTAYQSISEKFESEGINNLTDWKKKGEVLQTKLDEARSELDKYAVELNEAKRNLQEINNQQKSLKQEVDKQLEESDGRLKALDNEVSEIVKQLKEIAHTKANLLEKCSQIDKTIQSLNIKLAGVITCPNCKHEFTLGNDVDVEQMREELKRYEEDRNRYTQEYDSINDLDMSSKFDEKNNEIRLENKKRNELEEKIAEVSRQVLLASRSFSDAAGKVDQIDSTIESIVNSLHNMRKNMFDEAFNALDMHTNKLMRLIADFKNTIYADKQFIKSCEDSIDSLNRDNADDTQERLEKARIELENQRAELSLVLNKRNGELSAILEQSAKFSEFKTHLANLKIDAIAKLTNEFLETIGSDIRVSLSGYTRLKSGKIRDKISVSLIRDGVDCGSFDKFSAGEKCRVELASVLALHKLSNVSCDEGKGLNLLVIDEILDCTDESGLTNVFQALNDSQVTAIVVSHGNIAENYPNRLVIQKQNGISTINDLQR